MCSLLSDHARDTACWTSTAHEHDTGDESQSVTRLLACEYNVGKLFCISNMFNGINVRKEKGHQPERNALNSTTAADNSPTITLNVLGLSHNANIGNTPIHHLNSSVQTSSSLSLSSPNPPTTAKSRSLTAVAPNQPLGAGFPSAASLISSFSQL